LDCHTYNYFRLHTNVKFKSILKIKIINLKIIHVVINFNGNHHKKIGWILRRLWTHNGLLKWQHYACHIEKMKNVDSKKCQNSVKIKIKIKIKHHQMKNLLVKCIETFYIYILMFKKRHDCYNFIFENPFHII